jgi:hypothetical protein
MNVNGILLYTRAYNAASTAGAPAVIAIQIGKNFKGTSLNLYKSTGKATAGTLDFSQRSSSASTGAMFKEYNEATGILLIDAGYNPLSTTTASEFEMSDLTRVTSAYLTVNASKSPALVGVPQVQPRIATIKDVKAATTGGGAFTSGAWRTRTLNTLSDNSGIVTSLSANQFTLPAGTYYISAEAKAGSVNNHKLKIANITDTTDAIVGMSCQDTAGGSEIGSATLVGIVTITASKVFELQHRCQTTGNFGAANSFSVDEVYAQVVIEKIK